MWSRKGSVKRGIYDGNYINKYKILTASPSVNNEGRRKKGVIWWQAIGKGWHHTDSIFILFPVAGKPVKFSNRDDELRQYFVKKQQLIEAGQLEAFLRSSSPGVSSMVGSDQLYQLVKKRTDQAQVLATEVAEMEEKLSSELGRAKQATFDVAIKSIHKEVEATVGSRQHRAQAMKLMPCKYFCFLCS